MGLNPGPHSPAAPGVKGCNAAITVFRGIMKFCRVLLACVSMLLLMLNCCEATPLPFHRDLPFHTPTEGSGEDDLESPVTSPHTSLGPAHMAPPYSTHGPAHIAPSYSTPSPTHTPHSPAHPSDSAGVEQHFLEQVTDFLQENLLLVLVLSSLLAAIIFLACCASAMSRRRKVAAYYPSAFPAARYVDQRDTAGGVPSFHEVPDRPPDSRLVEPHDSARQLQQDILTAARKLRTPTKNTAAGRGGEDTKRSPPRAQKSQSEETPMQKEQEVSPMETDQEATPSLQC
ncbi:hypothetical protein AAFF_G00054550 [Aldrovandia affinis]|uniref:Transmembrane protein 119 n=1 Tax=Aldrovandia affinis TaxID=143900 RepID=A0AAD7S199_9TELE|nr:hypothetical protein AAFF_G00054550 [Aldrovandia affinis]